MHVMTKLTTLAATAALTLGAAGAAQAAQAIVATESQPFTVAAWDGTVAWSHYDGQAKDYRLLAWRDGATSSVDVKPSNAAFDVDLGTNRHGTTTAVYSRCATPPPSGGRTSKKLRGCDLYRIVLPNGAEQHLTKLSAPGADERQPTIWAGRIAFVRTLSSGRDELRIGDTTTGSRGTRLVVRAPKGQRIVDPKLTYNRIAYTIVAPRGRVSQRVIHLRTLASGRDEAIYRAASGGANEAFTTRPSFDQKATHLYWARTNLGSGRGNRLVRYTISTRMLSYAKSDSRVTSSAWASPALGLALGRGLTPEGGCDDAPGTLSLCTVSTTGPVSFTAAP